MIIKHIPYMDYLEAIRQRHSVRRYLSQPLCKELADGLLEEIDKCNKEGHLHIQLVANEPKAFRGINSYGKFSGVENYIVMAGEKAADLDFRIGYYGERLVLAAQTFGLNTCWVGLTYRKVPSGYVLGENEKVVCVIAVGYGEENGSRHKHKTREMVSNAGEATPQWFSDGVDAALLAPTAVNQQKFYFEYMPARDGGKPRVKAKRLFSLLGYTKIDLGIACCHFEIGAGKENFEWDR